MKNKRIFLFLLIVLLPIVTLVSYRYYQAYIETQRKAILFERRKASWMALKHTLSEQITKFNGEVGILIKDVDMNWEIAFNKEKLFPSASLAKIPIMAACFLAGQEGKLKLGRNIALKASDKLTGSGMLRNAQAGATFTVEELIGLMIYDSDNTATNILTNMLGIDYLNRSFKAFGLQNTTLSRKIADFNTRDKGIENYTTAEDMALLLERIYHRSLVSKDISERCLRLMKLSRTNDRIPALLPAEITVAHKTGLERGVCHDAGVVFTPKGNFLICVLTKHSEATSRSAKELIAKVAFYTYQYFTE
jgi:beta-lactamase class A